MSHNEETIDLAMQQLHEQRKVHAKVYATLAGTILLNSYRKGNSYSKR